MVGSSVFEEIEEVFVNELGTGSTYILEQNLREQGLTRETFRKTDIDKYVKRLLEEYNKVLGNHIDLIKSEIKKKVDHNKNKLQ